MNRLFLYCLLEAINSNLNGNTEDGAPRQYPDGYGWLSDVAIKRKFRDLVLFKAGPVWRRLAAKLGITEADKDNFRIAEDNARGLPDADEDPAKNLARLIDMPVAEVQQHYWDARVFGGTYLKEGKKGYKQTGAVSVSPAVSLAPVDIEIHTNTSKASKEEGKDRGMAPDGWKVVRHGLYAGVMSVCSTQMLRSGCTERDIQVFLEVLPYIWQETASRTRNNVHWVRLFLIEHKSPLGGCPEHLITAALTPRVLTATPTELGHYQLPSGLPEELLARVTGCRDLI